MSVPWHVDKLHWLSSLTCQWKTLGKENNRKLISHIYSCSSLPIMLSIWTGAFINPKLELWLCSPLLLLGSWLLSPSVISNTFVAPWAVACQAPLSMGFPRKEYWSGLLSPSPGDYPSKGIEPMSPALQVDSLQLSHQESPQSPGKPTVLFSTLYFMKVREPMPSHPFGFDMIKFPTETSFEELYQFL